MLDQPSSIAGREVAKLEPAPIVAIIPRTLDEVYRLAEVIIQSKLSPEALGTPQAVTIVLLKGLEIGLPPMAAMESIGVINGRACIYGDGIPALLWSKGFDIEEHYADEDDPIKMIAHCRITRPNGRVYNFKYSIKDAKENQLWGTKAWKNYGKRMLRMRARGWLARDCASDVLKGMPIYEEVRDYVKDGETWSDPEGNGKAQTLAPPAPPPRDEVFGISEQLAEAIAVMPGPPPPRDAA